MRPVSTLYNTAGIVKDVRRERVALIQSFAGVLEPDFNIAILEQLARQTDDSIKRLLDFLARAIQAKTLKQILTLSREAREELPAAALLQTFLRDCTDILLDTLRRVSDRLQAYDEDRRQRAELQDSLALLSNALGQLEEMNLFEQNVLGRIFAQWHKVIETAFLAFHPMPQPYVAGPPLAPDSPVFVGREDIFRWIEDNLSQPQKNVLVLHGMWRTGKTSILLQMEAGPLGKKLRERRQRPLFPVFIDLQRLPDPGTQLLLLRLAEAIAASLKRRDIACSPPPVASFQDQAHFRAFDLFLDAVAQLLDERQGLLVIMLDEFEILDDRVKAGKVDVEIFSYLRSLMQHQPAVTFMLAGRHRLDEVTAEYKNIVFNVAQHKEVTFLSHPEAERLIRDPVKPLAVTYDEQVVERILKLTGGHPYLIQQLCYACIDLLNQRKSGYQVGLDLLDDAVEATLRPGSASALEQLWDSVGEGGQTLLRSLARLTSDDQSCVAKEDLLAQAIQTGLDETEACAALERLQANRLVLRERLASQEKASYCHAFDLLRIWVTHKITEV